jgi:hypothetical protein
MWSEDLEELPPVLNPASRIRGVQQNAVPRSAVCGTLDIRLDRANERHNHLGSEFSNPLRKRLLPCYTGFPAGVRRHPIDRGAAGVREIAAGPLKHLEKIFVLDGAVDLAERAKHGAVEA